MCGSCPAASPCSKTAADSPSICTSRKRRRSLSVVESSRAQRASRSTNAWNRSTTSSAQWPRAPRGALRGRRSPAFRVSGPENPGRPGIEMASVDLGGDALWGLVIWFPGQSEGAPVDAHEVRGAQIDARLHGFLGRYVHRARDLPGRIGPDRQRGQVERPQGVAGLLEVVIVARVPGEVKAM